MDLSFSQSFWNRGDYPQYYQNGSVAETVTNPWYSSATNAAPFDQGKLPLPPLRDCSLETRTDNVEFYLILNVAVGGTNGFFPDNLGSKPWLDSSPSAMNGKPTS